MAKNPCRKGNARTRRKPFVRYCTFSTVSDMLIKLKATILQKKMSSRNADVKWLFS